MTINELVALISLVCGINSGGVSREYKEVCAERITNCAVGPNGEVKREVVLRCIEKSKLR
jgi:hypothetical protein